MKTPLVSVLIAAAFLAGCTPNPEAVCKKFEDLRAKSKDKDDKMSKEREKSEHDDCIGQLGAAKDASSDGYKGIVKCSDKSGWGEAMGCISDAVKADSKVKDAFEAWDKKKEEARKKKVADKVLAWPDAKTKSVDGKIKDFGGEKTTAFTIQLAEGFNADSAIKSENMASYEMKTDEEDFLIGPSVTVEPGIGAPDLDGAVKNAEETKHKILKKDKTAKGYVLESESDAGFTVTYVVANGEGSIECEARLFTDEQKAAKDKLLPWLEKMCSSLAVKG